MVFTQTAALGIGFALFALAYLNSLVLPVEHRASGRRIRRALGGNR